MGALNRLFIPDCDFDPTGAPRFMLTQSGSISC
jgi:hypothetical protein